MKADVILNSFHPRWLRANCRPLSSRPMWALRASSQLPARVDHAMAKQSNKHLLSQQVRSCVAGSSTRSRTHRQSRRNRQTGSWALGAGFVGRRWATDGQVHASEQRIAWRAGCYSWLGPSPFGGLGEGNGARGGNGGGAHLRCVHKAALANQAVSERAGALNY